MCASIFVVTMGQVITLSIISSDKVCVKCEFQMLVYRPSHIVNVELYCNGFISTFILPSKYVLVKGV